MAVTLAKTGVGGYAYGSTVTFAEYLNEEWLQGKPDLKATTKRSYEESRDLYLVPAWGHLKLAELVRSHFSQLVVELEKINQDEDEPSELLRRLIAARAYWQQAGDGRLHRRSNRPLSASRIKTIMAHAGSALSHAVKCGFLEHNPAERPNLPRVTKHRPLVWTGERVRLWEQTGQKPSPVMVWTVEQAREFLRFASHERLFAMYRLAMVRGPRRGELIGLQWSDVDLGNAVLLIRTASHGQNGGDDPKSEAGYRYIDLDAATVAALEEWRARQTREREAAGSLWEENDLVFTTELGRPLRPDGVTWRMTDLVHRSGLPPVTFHGLRHESATLSRAAGVEIEVISRTLGHAKPSFTSDYYGSVLPPMERDAAEVTAHYLDAGDGTRRDRTSEGVDTSGAEEA
ncbi:tyrosine-type recombinase/integrase [Nocardiopsis kunsanensis]|uniref:tyrosine-type recombinase/integrase n=1 Tax=Nocardiopsis kunsanensis TaxID=141693 RepID=UPI00187724E0|nr:site-specific integrase [Nocardiopsis kunsanensis]